MGVLAALGTLAEILLGIVIGVLAIIGALTVGVLVFVGVEDEPVSAPLALPPGPSALVVEREPDDLLDDEDEDEDHEEVYEPAVAFRRCRWDRFEAARYTTVPWCTRGHQLTEGQGFWAITAIDDQGPGEMAVCGEHAFSVIRFDVLGALDG